MQKPIGIGVNVRISNAQGQILFGQRKGGAGDREWCLPGGKLEFGESLVVCAIREVFEETGIKLGNVELINTTNDPRPSKDEHYIHFTFTAYTTQEPKLVEPNSFYQWVWFHRAELPSPIFYGHEKLLEAIKWGRSLAD